MAHNMVLFSPLTASCGGVYFLLNLKSNIKYLRIESVVQGRPLQLTFESDDIIHHILNMYVPNDANERMLFYIQYMILLV